MCLGYVPISSSAPKKHDREGGHVLVVGLVKCDTMYLTS